MKLSDFSIGLEFSTPGGGRWRCTDVATRVIVAIRLDQVKKSEEHGGVRRIRTLNQRQAEAEGWFNGPPYAVAEVIFGEDDLPACSLAPEANS